MRMRNLLILAVFLLASYFAYHVNTERKRLSLLNQALRENRFKLQLYRERRNELPRLSEKFWEVEKNPYLSGISWNTYDKKSGIMRPPNEKDLRVFLNPFSGRFDWLAETADGKLFSPESFRKLASQGEIFVVDIRCPTPGYLDY